MENFDFSGWATRNNLKCSDGRTIMKDAFKHNDGQKVPLVWNHQHNDSMNVLGHALLENREEGVYAYCKFNDTESGKNAKVLVEHGDVSALSIYANQLRQQNGNVFHGAIREVSLVLAGANPGAFIDSVIMHGEESEEDAVIYTGEEIILAHANDDEQAKEETEMAEEKKEKTVADVFNEFTDEQKNVVYAMIGQAIEDATSDEDDEDNDKESEGGNESMKQNVFEKEEIQQGTALSHADQEAIIALAKQSNVGSLKLAIQNYVEETGIIKHSDDGIGVFEDYGVLFPELELITKGEPETIYKNDQSWVTPALAKIHKSPFSRIRTRQADRSYMQSH